MDPIFIIELVIVAIIICIQFWVFFRNNASLEKLEEVYPDGSKLKVKRESLEAESNGEEEAVIQKEIALIEENQRFSPTFKEIIRTTNNYLTRNKGGADFEILKEMAQDKTAAQETSIESNITLPLYIGLLCTFTGVIIGLVKIALVGVSDAAIQSFIGGVLIGMIGSAMGLGLTVRSNSMFRITKEQLDEGQYEYFTFLRTFILPIQPKEAEEPVGSLRKNLASFNEGFAQYQEHMNSSLQETLRLFSELKDVFNQIRSIEQQLNGMGHFLQANDGLINKQVQYIDDYVKRAEAFSNRLQDHFTRVDRQVGALVDENIRSLDKSTQAAYIKMDRYLASLEHTDRQAFAQALQQDLNEVHGDIENLQQKSTRINAMLIEQLSKENGLQDQLVSEIQTMNARLDRFIKGSGDFMNSTAFKIFVYAGTAAFVIGMLGGVLYIVNSFSL